MRRSGVTLIELSYVLAILAVITIFYVLSSSAALDGGNSGRAKAEMGQLARAVSQYHYDMHAYPDPLTALKNASPYDGSQWVTTAMFPATDPWGRSCAAGSAYCYSYSSNGFRIWSMGKGGTNDSGSSYTDSFSGDDFGVYGK